MAAHTLRITVHVGGQSGSPRRRRKRPHGSVQPGRPGDYIANDRSRQRRIAPSPG